MISVTECNNCHSTKIELLETHVKNKVYEVTDDFYYGTRVIALKTTKLTSADIVRIYLCKGCGKKIEITNTVKFIKAQ